MQRLCNVSLSSTTFLDQLAILAWKGVAEADSNFTRHRLRVPRENIEVRNCLI